MFSRKLIIIARRIVTVLTVLGASHEGLQAASARAPTAPAANPPTTTILITGAPSEVTWPGQSALSSLDAPCILFFVSAPQPAPLLTLTTTGLGRSQLAEAPAARCPPASAGGWQEQLALRLDGGYRRRSIALRLDPQTAPPDGGLLEARILALVGNSEAGVSSLKVRPEVDPPWLQSFYWFLGIAVPALVAFAITRAAQRLDARNDFLVYRILEIGKITETIDYIQSVLKDPKITEAGRIVYETMRDKGTLEKLTSKSRREVMKFCYANDMAGFVKLMKRLFPREAATLRLASTDGNE